jgi:hypothetical protein
MQRSTKQSILIRPPYVYSPVHADPLLTDIIRYLAIPAIILSGVAMWQQGRISRRTSRGSSAVVHDITQCNV